MYEYIIKAAAAVVLEELMLKSGIVEKIFQIGSSSLFIFQMMVEMCECRKILPNWENWGRFSLIGKMMKEMCICRKILPNLEELTNLRNLEDLKILPNLEDFWKIFQIWDKCCAAVAAAVKTKSPV